MATHKLQRSSQDIHRELTDILRSMKDPRVQMAMLSVVRVELTRDLSQCRVFVSSLNGEESAKEAVKGLTSGAGYVRREISLRLDMRRSPAFVFIADNSIEHGADISRKLSQLLPKDSDEQQDDE